MLRRTFTHLLLVLLLAGLFASVADARQAIRGPAYRAYAPTGWHIDKGSGNGWNTTTITPPTHVFNGRDTALVSIAVASVSTVKRLVGSEVRVSDKAELVQNLISVPQDATNFKAPNPPVPSRFRGKPAMTYTVNYTYTGHGTVHVATLVRRGKRIYLIQTITDQDVTFLGSGAVDTIRDSWRWK